MEVAPALGRMPATGPESSAGGLSIGSVRSNGGAIVASWRTTRHGSEAHNERRTLGCETAAESGDGIILEATAPGGARRPALEIIDHHLHTGRVLLTEVS